MKLLCDKLNLSSQDHLLEIGTGWGGLAIFAAQEYGCKVTTTTISQEQFDYTKQLISDLNLGDLIELKLCDYRELTGTYNKLISIEMIEAVGLEHLPVYFETCSRLLTNDGVMALQAITIRDHYYEAARKSVDFIQRHIFPGSGIPSMSAMMDAVKNKTDLVMLSQEDFGLHYARTLKEWSLRLEKNYESLLKLSYPRSLYRLWQYYFSYCEGGFRERSIGLAQIILTKPRFGGKRAEIFH
jgi:cyclopropane-fatty-acyl-phospholipid synthase